MKKYIINNDWDWVTHFENEIAEYCGSKYAIACDSNSNAIRLLLHYLGVEGQEIGIPAKTYVSVPNQIILSNKDCLKAIRKRLEQNRDNKKDINRKKDKKRKLVIYIISLKIELKKYLYLI